MREYVGPIIGDCKVTLGPSVMYGEFDYPVETGEVQMDFLYSGPAIYEGTVDFLLNSGPVITFPWNSETGVQVDSVEEIGYQYAFTSKWGMAKRSSLKEARRAGNELRNSVKLGRESGDLKYHGIVKRRISGSNEPWVTVTGGNLE